jgi:ADP-ribosylglycohydrolase
MDAITVFHIGTALVFGGVVVAGFRDASHQRKAAQQQIETLIHAVSVIADDRTTEIQRQIAINEAMIRAMARTVNASNTVLGTVAESVRATESAVCGALDPNPTTGQESGNVRRRGF